jgi:hypothetical protein
MLQAVGRAVALVGAVAVLASAAAAASPPARGGDGCSAPDATLMASASGSAQFGGLARAALSRGCAVYVDDPTTLYLELIRGSLAGRSRAIGPTGVTLFDIALTASGDLYGVSGAAELYKVNRNTGAATAIGPIGYQVNALVVSPAGIMYGAGGGTLVTIDRATGKGTAVGSPSSFSSSGDLAFVSKDRVYLSATGAAGDDLIRIDSKTGVAARVGSIGRPQVYGLCDSLGTLFGVDVGGELLTIDPRSGAGTVIARGGPQAYGMAGLPTTKR